MFAKKLKELMAEMHITQAELAARSGLTKASISQYVNGKNKPRGKAVQAIAEALGVPEAYFTDKTPPAPAGTYAGLPPRLKICQAARLMGVGAEMIRINLQRGNLPFGYALRGKGDRFTYFINTEQFMSCTGVTEQEVLDVL